MRAAIYSIGSAVEVVLRRKRYPKRAPKKSSAPPIKSSVRDAPKSIRSRHNQPPENEPRQSGAIALGWHFFCPDTTAPVAQLRRTLGGKPVSLLDHLESNRSALVLKNFYWFQRHQSVCDHCVQLRQKVLDLFSTIHYLDQHRKILRQTQNLCRM